jgi:hypothetical protein
MANNPNPSSSGKVLGKAGLGENEPLKYRLFAWLREHPKERNRGYLRKASIELHINYKEKKELLWKYASEFKNDIRSLPEYGRGSTLRVCSKPDSQHACFAEVFVPDCLSRVKFYDDVTNGAVDAGWRLSRNRNKNLCWDRERFSVGRVQWWVDGRVRVHVVDPHKVAEPLSRVKQLLYAAFVASGLIADLSISEVFLRGVQWFSSHDVYMYEKPLPYKKITAYREMGIEEIVTGDLSHRSGLEVKTIKPDIVSKYEALVDLLREDIVQGKLDREAYGKVIEQNTLAINGFNSYLATVNSPKPKVDAKSLSRLYE